MFKKKRHTRKQNKNRNKVWFVVDSVFVTLPLHRGKTLK